jgi:hypothetical protein
MAGPVAKIARRRKGESFERRKARDAGASHLKIRTVPRPARPLRLQTTPPGSEGFRGVEKVLGETMSKDENVERPVTEGVALPHPFESGHTFRWPEDALQRRMIHANAEMFEDGVRRLAWDHAYFVLAPLLLTERRRRAGDSVASPRDYLCGCELDPRDELPICDGLREKCKFAHRKPPPPPRLRDDSVRFNLARALQGTIMEGLIRLRAPEIDEALLAIDSDIAEAQRRRIAVLGRGFARNTDW